MTVITRHEALNILKQHSLRPTDCTISHLDIHYAHSPTTIFNPTDLFAVCGDDCESFDSELGIQDEYKLSDIKNWLGY